MHATLPLLKATDFPPLRRRAVDTLQVNLGYICNQSCLHCHVNAGPTRTEQMDRATSTRCSTCSSANGIRDARPHRRRAGAESAFSRSGARGARDRRVGVHVIDRCNLTILFEPGQEDLAEFLARARVEVVASLPCYSQENVDRQRGKGVFDKSIRALQALNALGYGRDGRGLALYLVYNPQGPSLPPPQAQLEADYRRMLGANFGIVFTRLLTLANMPIAALRLHADLARGSSATTWRCCAARTSRPTSSR